MKRGVHVVNLSKRIVKLLKPLSKKIIIAGSIRRREPNPKDIDIALIPKDKDRILNLLKTKGKFIQGGDKKLRFKIQGIKVELYYTTPESWGATLLAYSSKKGSAIGLRVYARMRGYHLNQYGLYKKGKLIAGKTEKDIYKALGKSYKEAWER